MGGINLNLVTLYCSHTKAEIENNEKKKMIQNYEKTKAVWWLEKKIHNDYHAEYNKMWTGHKDVLPVNKHIRAYHGFFSSHQTALAFHTKWTYIFIYLC